MACSLQLIIRPDAHLAVAAGYPPLLFKWDAPHDEPEALCAFDYTPGSAPRVRMPGPSLNGRHQPPPTL